jgi:hypothetical protein
LREPSGRELAYASLDRSLFGGAELSGATLTATTMSNANFQRATLFGAQLRGAVGRGTTFANARLVAADLSHAQLLAANFELAKLQGALLSSSSLQAANFRGSRMQGIDASGAALQGASFEQTFLHDARFSGASIQGTSFRDAALQNALMCTVPFRNDFENADRRDLVVKREKCRTGAHDYGGYFFDDIDEKYSLPTDTLPKSSEPNAGWNDFSPYPSEGLVPEILNPENLKADTFPAVLGRATSDLPEDIKARVVQVFERLKPGAWSLEEDDAERAIWTNWAKESAPEQSHEKALAARLESIACVAEGAPYVARGLLRAGRFHDLYESNEVNEREKARFFERLRNAFGGGDLPALAQKASLRTISGPLPGERMSQVLVLVTPKRD